MIKSDPAAVDVFNNYIEEAFEKTAADIREELIASYTKEFNQRLMTETAKLVMQVHQYYEVQNLNNNLVITVRNPEC